MGNQLHKRFTDGEVKELLKRYMNSEVDIASMLQILKIKRRRFFELLGRYKADPSNFSIQYERKSSKRLSIELEHIIVKELKTEKRLIENKDIPVKSFNYSYIKDQIFKDCHRHVSLPTIINRAKQNDCYMPRPQRKAHDREVLTNYIGELIQHDSSHHLWAPYAQTKWYLITSIDDYSRYLIYAALLERETAWAHIVALESVFLKYGMPLRYYSDNHSIFRFVQGRDSIWRDHRKLTDDVLPQWKQVLYDCNVDITYALSPQAKGKIERPYQWLQDRIVRTCARENIKTLESTQEVLQYEVYRYNNRQRHSTTMEIPAVRFENAIKNNKTLFRKFTIRPPYLSHRDIFCLREERTVDAYRKISIDNLQLKIQNAPIGEKLQLRIYPDIAKGIAEIRCWQGGKLIDTINVKLSDLKSVHF